MKNENLLNDIARISYNSLISKEEIKSDDNMEFITYGTTPLIKNYEAFIINKNTLKVGMFIAFAASICPAGTDNMPDLIVSAKYAPILKENAMHK